MSIWHNIFCVITAPKYGWELINESNIPVGKVMKSVYVPLLVVLALSCFVPMIYDRTISFGYSLLNGIVMVSSFFVAYSAGSVSGVRFMAFFNCSRYSTGVMPYSLRKDFTKLL